MKDSFHFAQPLFLWFLSVVIVLFLLWTKCLVQRRNDIRRLKNARSLPFPECFRFMGPLAFWAWLLLAVASIVIALSMPQVFKSSSGSGPVDLVVIQDGSASSRVADVYPTRWQRSMRFLGTLVELLPWKGDRMGLAVFANHALPQIRLVRDPNTILFFIEHLNMESPFALDENTSWDTNAYEGIRWGLKLFTKDEMYYGKSANPKAFLLLSDGDRFTGTTESAIVEARNLHIPIYVIGIGTLSGGPIPLPKALEKKDISTSYWQYRAYLEQEKKRKGIPQESIHSSIDRDSLQRIAALGGGRYFELDTEPDDRIALTIIGDVRKIGSPFGEQKVFKDLYWSFLLLAAFFFGLAIISR